MLRIVQLLFASLVMLTALPAFAAFSLASGYPQREGGEFRPVQLVSGAGGLTGPDPLAQPQTGFNRADCFDTEQAIKILLTDIPAEATDVEIWARRDNTSCADPLNRPGGANVQCWKVASWSRDQVVNKVVTFKPMQVIQAIDKQTSVDTAEGLDPAAVCAKDAHMTPVLTYLQIMAFNSGTVVGWSSGGGTTGAVIAIPTAYDLAGPNPPAKVSVTSARGGFDVNFESGLMPVDFDGYRVYCFPGAADAGCPANPFVAGQFPPSDFEQYICASGLPASGRMIVPGLASDKSYAVAVAAHDKAGNPGKFSEVSCGVPAPAPAPPAAPVDDTVTSGCSCTVGARHNASFGVAAIALAVAIALRRRQR